MTEGILLRASQWPVPMEIVSGDCFVPRNDGLKQGRLKGLLRTSQ